MTLLFAFPKIVREMEEADPIREIPVLLLTSGKSSPSLRLVSGPNWARCAASDCVGQRALDASR
jgi:hypothetical protein